MVAAGGVHAVEAAEATTLKALMQLHASSPIKQRAGRDKRATRSMLQDSRETLLQSISVTAQTGVQNAAAHMAALHCITAAQDSMPAPPAAALSAADAPPGFAPKPSAEPSAPSPFALRLWPFGASQDCSPCQWPVEDTIPLVQMLRVHKLLASKSKQQVPLQLLVEILQSASALALHSPSLAQRLIEEVKSVSPEKHSLVSSKLDLVELQLLHSKGGTHSSSAAEKLWGLLSLQLSEASNHSALSSPSPGAHHNSSHALAEALLQLGRWCQSPGSTSFGMRTDMYAKIREVALDSSDTSPTYLPSDASDEALCWAAAVNLVPLSAAAWLAYADYLHTLSQSSWQANASLPQLPDKDDHISLPGSQGSETADESRSDTMNATERQPKLINHQATIAMVKAYCTYLRLSVQSVGQAGMPEDPMPVLLKLFHVLSEDQFAPTVTQAIQAGIEAVPVLTWRPVVPQLFALLAHDDAGVWNLAQRLLQDLELLDPAAVLYPALVESRRSSKGLWPLRL